MGVRSLRSDELVLCVMVVLIIASFSPGVLSVSEPSDRLFPENPHP